MTPRRSYCVTWHSISGDGVSIVRRAPRQGGPFLPGRPHLPASPRFKPATWLACGPSRPGNNRLGQSLTIPRLLDFKTTRFQELRRSASIGSSGRRRMRHAGSENQPATRPGCSTGKPGSTSTTTIFTLFRHRDETNWCDRSFHEQEVDESGRIKWVSNASTSQMKRCQEALGGSTKEG